LLFFLTPEPERNATNALMPEKLVEDYTPVDEPEEIKVSPWGNDQLIQALIVPQ